jgi:hypothetical protein
MQRRNWRRGDKRVIFVEDLPRDAMGRKKSAARGFWDLFPRGHLFFSPNLSISTS